MNLAWQPRAIRQRERINAYVELESPSAAIALDAKFRESARLLLDFPDLGRQGRREGTRELVVHPNYLLVYRLRAETIEILTILHAAQRWP